MSENMDKFRSLDGSSALIDQPFINGCRIDDVLEIVVNRLLDFQGRDLACAENAEALEHLHLAREALLKRRRIREQQGVINTQKPHQSEPRVKS